MKYLLLIFSILCLISCQEEPRTINSLTPASAKLIFELDCTKATPQLKTFLEEKSSKNKEWKLLKYFKLRVSNIDKLRFILDQNESIHLIETKHPYDLKKIYNYLNQKYINRTEFTFNEVLFEDQILYQFSRKNRQISLYQINPQLIIAGSDPAIFKCLKLNQETQLQKSDSLYQKLSQTPPNTIAQLISLGGITESSSWPILKSISRIEAVLNIASSEKISLTSTITLSKEENAQQLVSLSQSLLAFTSLPVSLKDSLKISNESNYVKLEASLNEEDLTQINIAQQIKDQKRATEKQSIP
jgi:hypothetical protein